VCWGTAPVKKAVFLSQKIVLTCEQRIFVLKHYFCNEAYVLCQDAFQEAFPNDTVPNKTAIYHVIMKFEETGCVCMVENVTTVAPS
jgi:hypothetical protein